LSARVYVTQDDGTKNLNAAKRFGLLVAVAHRSIYPDENTPGVAKRARSILAPFDQDKDFVLPVGDPVHIAATLLALGHLGHRRVKLLKWDREGKEYYPVEIEV
jgi:hypothetical protein